ncbi:enoyl-CoA hydratase/isomerase family protein [Agrobacterium salinitolerans]|nr:enoyl-CoA hydratase/isomerase family protein [Agrobacterium salinitolerans]
MMQTIKREESMATLVGCELHEGIAIVTIDSPPVNALGQGVRSELLAMVREIDRDQDIKAAVLCCAGRTFVAGADISELGKPPLSPVLPEVLDAIETARIPWVAAIHGTALGGGLELALACAARIADVSAKFGLPEVTLGMVPGAGGTVRLPRLIPMSDAIDMVTGGKPVTALKALSSGLVDRLCERDLLSSALAFASALSGKPKPLSLLDRPCRNVDGVDWDELRKTIKAKARGAEAPVEALHALRDNLNLPAREALKEERRRFLRLASSEQAAALRYAFFAERSTGRSLATIESAPAELQCVGVVGGGTMGAGIAIALLLSGSEVRLLERDSGAAEAARTRVKEMLDGSIARGVVSQDAANDAINRFVAETDAAALRFCGLVIEAVFEDMEAKRNVFSRLDAVMPKNAVLATNTSYLDINMLAETTADPTRVLGLHFFAPAHVMRLLEIVRGRHTGNRALATGAALAKNSERQPSFPVSVMVSSATGSWLHTGANVNSCSYSALCPNRSMLQCVTSVSPWGFSKCRISAVWILLGRNAKTRLHPRASPTAALQTGFAKPVAWGTRLKGGGMTTLRVRRRSIPRLPTS